ncbi:TNF receptor-associated factor 3-like [Clytia hemisphaerica]|uniref:MATH domain-containing protein n=2 Tax=Clytia hemisphaerica TaxID=252671 RepID=A0A7M5XCH0_9CNID|eukprot:TCONS_00066099-protein
MEIQEQRHPDPAMPISQQLKFECNGNCHRFSHHHKQILPQQNSHCNCRNKKIQSLSRSTNHHLIQNSKEVPGEESNTLRNTDKEKPSDSLTTMPRTPETAPSDSKMTVQLSQQLAVERKRNDELCLRIEQLQITLESADINYEILKQKFMEQFQTFQDELNILKRNYHKHTESGPNSPSLGRRRRAINTVSEQQNELKILTNTVEENTRNIDDIDLRLQIHENTRYNGRILWKIDDFHSRRQQVLSGELHALHSAPCYSSDYGYKFCLRAYLNGDGVGEGTHVSLFLVVMKSDHDRVLEWPFQKKVKMTLINQQNRRRDHTEVMTPNKDSASFQRPKNDTNVASGCPLFMALDRLDAEGFVKEDVLFFDVTVE